MQHGFNIIKHRIKNLINCDNKTRYSKDVYNIFNKINSGKINPL